MTWKTKEPESMHIPICLGLVVVEKQIVNQFKLYLYLKVNTNGKVYPNKNFISSLSTELGRSVNTIKTWLRKLIELDWIGFDAFTQVYHIRKFERVCDIENLAFKKRAIIFEPEYFSLFEGFIGGLVYSHFFKCNLKRDRRRVVSKKGNTIQPGRDSSLYTQIAAIVVAKSLGISLSTAFRLKKASQQASFIDVIGSTKQLPYVALPFQKINSFYKTKQFEGAYFYKGKFYKRLPDYISPSLVFSKR